MKKGIIESVVVALVALLAIGCTEDLPISGLFNKTEEGGNFRLLVSDDPGDILDFTSLNITISEIGVLPDGESAEWITYDFEPKKEADLRKLIGDNATEIFYGDVPAGDYKKVFIHVDNVTGYLDGEETDPVKIPGGKLHISRHFTVSEVNEDAIVNFVFDITVFRAGKSGKYILKPQLAESGPNQNFTEVEAQGNTEKHQEKNKGKHGKPEDELQLQLEGEPTLGTEVILTVTEEGAPVEGATVTVNDVELAEQTDSNGQITIELPDTPGEVKIMATLGDKTGKLELDLEA